MRDYIYDACEEIDAAMFSGEGFYSLDERTKLNDYIGRWQRKMKEFEEIATEDVDHPYSTINKPIIASEDFCEECGRQLDKICPHCNDDSF
jgi:hypothetical protein